jgi:hypothetical protein
MVDSEKRRKLAFHLRHISVGVISNDEFEINIGEDVTHGWLPEQYYRSKESKIDDSIILPMLELCWGLYDDTRHHYLTGGDKLSPESLKVIARCILFLLSDQEYEWPYFDSNSPFFKFSLAEIVICILTLGQYYRVKRKEKEEAFLEFQTLGNFDIWPFFKLEDYETALQKQPFLSIGN